MELFHSLGQARGWFQEDFLLSVFPSSCEIPLIGVEVATPKAYDLDAAIESDDSPEPARNFITLRTRTVPHAIF